MIVKKLMAYPAGRVACAVSAGMGAMLLRSSAWIENTVFIGGAAQLASLLCGSPTVKTAEGWVLPLAEVPVIVTAACSATDFYVMTAVLLGWHLAKRTGRVFAVIGAMLAAVPLTLAINALRIVAVAQAHRWAIPHAPEAYEKSLHMLTGVAVFLPALIALNLIFETYGRSSDARACNH
ncbi:MAG: archaeosortase/exosortase family protein [Rariglobus sp.]